MPAPPSLREFRLDRHHHRGVPSSNDDPLDFVQADGITPAIVELRRPGRRVVCHRGGFSSVPPFLR
jgi:hypothetical protein